MVEKNIKKKAVVLLSGGLDSAVTLYWAKAKKYETFCLAFDYGQRHKKEIMASRKIARVSGNDWRLIRFKLPWKGSALLDKHIPVPANRETICKIPSTYVPARNLIFLSFAASFAEVIGAKAVFIGANEIDFSGYPDCRLPFLKIFERTLRVGTKSGVEGRKVKIIAPLIKKNKAEIVKLGVKLNVPFELTWSCYKGKAKPCKVCDSCRWRQQGFAEAKITDPLL